MHRNYNFITQGLHGYPNIILLVISVSSFLFFPVLLFLISGPLFHGFTSSQGNMESCEESNCDSGKKYGMII